MKLDEIRNHAGAIDPNYYGAAECVDRLKLCIMELCNWLDITEPDIDKQNLEDARKAQGERDEWKSRFDWMEAAATDLQIKHQNLQDVLRRLEWASNTGHPLYQRICPACGVPEHASHLGFCILAKALK